MRLYDGQAYSSWVNTTINVTILNSAPNVSLTGPADGNITTNRTPTFSWSGSDDDSDSLQYELNLSCYYSGGGTCAAGNRYVQRATIGSATSYVITPYLEYLLDNGYYYNWTIRAWDGEAFGDWFAVKRNISIQSDISISCLWRHVQAKIRPQKPEPAMHKHGNKKVLHHNAKPRLCSQHENNAIRMGRAVRECKRWHE